MKIYDQFGIPRDTKHIRAVQYLEEVKTASGSDPWPVIEACFKVWEETAPSEYTSHLFYLDDIRSSRADKFASSGKKDRKHGGILRYTIDIPEKVMFMIRCLYDSSELPMDREFFMKFAKRFPKYKIAKKM